MKHAMLQERLEQAERSKKRSAELPGMIARIILILLMVVELIGGALVIAFSRNVIAQTLVLVGIATVVSVGVLAATYDVVLLLQYIARAVRKTSERE